MARPARTPGSIGTITLTRRGTTWEASCRVTDHAGIIHRKSARNPDPAIARQRVTRAATALLTETQPLTSSNTINDAIDSWLDTITARAGELTPRTIDRYTRWATHIRNLCGAVPLHQVTTGLCETLLARYARTHSNAATNHVRKILTLTLAHAARLDAIHTNPVRDTTRRPDAEKIMSTLTATGYRRLHDLCQQWHSNQRGGTPPNQTLLTDVWDIMLGTSARPSEVLALRPCDLGINHGRMTVTICGKIVQSAKTGTVREPYPKHRRQTRTITVPEFTERVLRRRLTTTPSNDPSRLLFTTQTGQPRSVGSIGQLMRAFRTNHADLITNELGIPLTEFTCKLFRRTAATVVEHDSGLELAAHLLGHSDTRTTERHYAIRAPEVNPATATTLDDWHTTPPDNVLPFPPRGTHTQHHT